MAHHDAWKGFRAAAVVVVLVAASWWPTARADDEEQPAELDPVEVVGLRSQEWRRFLDPAPWSSRPPLIAVDSLPPSPVEQVLQVTDVESCDDLRGNPVKLPSGEKVEREVDFASDGEMGLALVRTYGERGGRLFGTHWRSSFDFSLEWEDPAVEIRAVRPDGSVVSLRPHGGAWVQRPDRPLPRLVRQGDGLYTLHTETGGVETYDASGWIHVVMNAHGIGWFYAYAQPGQQLQSVTHTSGRSVQFRWTVHVRDGASRHELNEVVDPAGNVFAYAYHHVGLNTRRLASVTLPGPPTTTVTYDYEPPARPGSPLGRLVGKAIDGVRYSDFTYATVAQVPRAVSTQHAGGVDRFTFDYQGDPAGAWTVVETNPLGHRTVRVYQGGKKVSVTGEASPSCPRRHRAVRYDEDGRLDRVEGFNGGVTTFGYDAAGRIVRRTEALGTAVERTTTYAWDGSHNRLLGVTHVGSSETRYAYGADGRLASGTVLDLASGQSRTVAYRYALHPGGMLASMAVDSPVPGQSRTFLYSPTGDLLEVRNAAGHATRYAEHNALGQPGRVTTPSGAVTEYVYDARGRVVVERTYPSGSPVETRYAYGASGLLDARYASDGTSTLFHYDAARRLVQEDVAEPDGGLAVRRFTHNAMSQPIRVEVGRDP